MDSLPGTGQEPAHGVALAPQQGRRFRPVLTISVAAVLTVAVAVALTAFSRPARSLPAAKNLSLTEVGQPGKRVSLSEFSGRPVIVNFFASWCEPCKRETPLLARFYRDHHGQVAIIGVDSNDQTAAALKFMTAEGVSYPVGADPFPASATTSFGVTALPQTFMLNAQHRIVKHVFGEVTLAELEAWVASAAGRGHG